MNKQLFFNFYKPKKIDIRNKEQIKEEVVLKNNYVVFLNGIQCTTAHKANPIEGWIDLFIILSIDENKPYFLIKDGEMAVHRFYGDVEIYKIGAEL